MAWTFGVVVRLEEQPKEMTSKLAKIMMRYNLVRLFVFILNLLLITIMDRLIERDEAVKNKKVLQKVCLKSLADSV